MGTKKSKPYRHQGNRALYDAMMELRRSSAAQLHEDKRRKGSRSAKKDKAIKDFGKD